MQQQQQHTDNPVSYQDIFEAHDALSRGSHATTHRLTPISILQFWLWGCDANEVCDRGKCDFQSMQLTGMVCTQILKEAYESPTEEDDHTTAQRRAPCIFDNSDAQHIIDSCGVFLPHFYEDEEYAAAQKRASSNKVAGSDAKDTKTIEYKAKRNTDYERDEAQRLEQLRLDAVQKEKDDMRRKTQPTRVPLNVTMMELHDIVTAMQIQWPLLCQGFHNSDSEENRLLLLQTVDRLVMQLFLWFGQYLFDDNIHESRADDIDFVDSTPPRHTLKMTNMAIKYYLNIFFVMFRLLFLERNAVSVPATTAPAAAGSPKGGSPTGGSPTGESPTGELPTGVPPKFSIESFHLEAGVDDFHMLGMYSDIHVGCLLEYKHSYSGYYNNVSQVVYRHFPSYKQRRPMSMEDVEKHDAPYLTVLPCLKQIYPEIQFAFEDHHFEQQRGAVRVPVLMSYKKNIRATRTDDASETSTSSPQQQEEQQEGQQEGRPLPQDMVKARKPARNPASHPISSNLQARIAACLGGAQEKTAGGDVDAARRTLLADWLWFCIGPNLYLVSTQKGIAYKGSCRDLLTFYIESNS